MSWTACSALAVFGKVGVDQLLYTPVATGIFYATLDTLEGHPETLPQTLKVPPDLVRAPVRLYAAKQLGQHLGSSKRQAHLLAEKSNFMYRCCVRILQQLLKLKHAFTGQVPVDAAGRLHGVAVGARDQLPLHPQQPARPVHQLRPGT